MDSYHTGGVLQEQVREASAKGIPLAIQGSGSKAFFGRPVNGQLISINQHQGVVTYEPTELVITARAGTPLSTLEAVLAAEGQMLAFEPPHFGSTATLGGTLACGLSGPRRPYVGAARDFVLGIRMLNGQGELLRFGGEVMKNVAGYDISRLMVGALGTLGVLLEASLKVLPKPVEEITLVRQAAVEEAITTMTAWARQSLPVSATGFDGQQLYIRLSGTAAGVRAARTRIGGEVFPEGAAFWQSLREHTHPFFAGTTPLWRLSVPANTPPLAISGLWFLDWGGAQRWLKTTEAPASIRRVVSEVGGHAMLFRGGDRRGEVFHPLAPGLQRLHCWLKMAFDPRGILNAQRMYREW